MIRPALTLPLIALVLTGCYHWGPPPKRPAPSPCGVGFVEHYVGRPRTDENAALIAQLSGAKAIRWIEPGMAVTMDYREDRLNVTVDEKGVITRVYCG